MSLAWFLGGLTLGSVITGIAVLRWHWHRLEILGLAKVEAEVFRARTVCGDLDHEHRLRLRLETQLDALRAGVEPYVAGLLDELAARDQTIARLTAPRHRRPSPIPPYGNRAASGADAVRTLGDAVRRSRGGPPTPKLRGFA